MPVFLRTILLSIAGLVLAVFAGLSFQKPDVLVSQNEIPAIPQTLSATTSITSAATSTTTAIPAKKIAVTPGTKTGTAPKTIPTPGKTETPATPSAPAASPTASKPILSQSALNDTVRGAIVNIICTSAVSGPLNSISASGVMIDGRGVILTNAHVAQYFLLKDYPSQGFVECVVRTGSPATPKYKAELVFIPPSWITANAVQIGKDKPTGNGEHDYALIRITGTVHSNIQFPAGFPFLPISVDPPLPEDSILIAGYPAGFLGGITVQQNLYASSAFAKVGEVFTFEADTIDLFSLGGSVLAQQGASGGAAANESGVLMGIVVTSSEGADTASRDLRAISTAYIVKDFQKEAGMSLTDYLSGDVAAHARTFSQNTAPALTEKLVKVIENR